MYLVEGAAASEEEARLPGCEGAAYSWDGGKGLADLDTLPLCLQLVLIDNQRLVSAAF